MIGYIENIKDACTTIFDGMAVTFSHLFRTPITVQYPDKTPEPVVKTLPERYRGHLEVDMDICISCRACERDCPIECIVIDDVKIPKDTVMGVSGKESPRVKEATRFDIVLYKCMYCGLCVEPCPTGAIRFTKEFEGATSDLSKLHLRFVSEDRKAKVMEKNALYEKEQEEKARLKAEAAAAKKKADEEAKGPPEAKAEEAPPPAEEPKTGANPPDDPGEGKTEEQA
ncbi:MAG: 4Fe-4S binding protein [Candidatus Eisenbacteria bacterium]